MSESAAAGVILIADDNPEARRMLDIRVKKEGHRTIMAENGREALDVLTREPIDVLLLDIDMPEMDGYAVLAAVRENPQLSHLPVLIISGGGDQDDLIRCIEMGAVDYLPKPFNQAVLRARITSCLAQKKQRDQERLLLQVAQPLATGTAVPGASTVEMSAQPTPGSFRITPLPRSTVPSRIGRIVIGRLLGIGGMGEVYHGHHELLDLPVAVKLMRPELTSVPNSRDRLLREARMAVKLSHRHIVRMLEVGETEHGVHLVFEYVSGGSLADLLNRQPLRRLSVESAVRVTTEIAAALAASSSLGIVHRDIKPANVLLTAEGEVRVGDYGLAKQDVSIPHSNSHSTSEYMVVGTPHYMAPEQLVLGGPLDVRTDLYALGGVLFEMLVGHAPFGVPHPGMPTIVGRAGVGPDIFHHIQNTAALPPSHFRPEVPAPLDAVCLKLLAKSPDDRYQSPESLLTSLLMSSSSSTPTS